MYLPVGTTFIILNCFIEIVSGHGRMIDPAQRSSLWRVFPGKGFEPNYNDNELFCGGAQVQWQRNGGKCGTCGDPYDGERKNEAGGIYATGYIARRYQKGQDIEVEVELTANHLGYMRFKICPQNDITTQVQQECLDQHVLELAGQPGVTKYEPGDKKGIHVIKLALPAEITCEQCVLQWHYIAGNNYDCDANGVCCTGCGPQETFINCADVAIDGDASDNTPKPSTSAPTAAPSTKAPTTKAPTVAPTTKAPTAAPTTKAPTAAPTTKAPTAAPETKAPTPEPTTKAPSTTTRRSTETHNPTCSSDEIIDCEAIGVFAGLGYDGWCNQYCEIQHSACTADLCQCGCKKVINCYAVGLFASAAGMDEYCFANCQDGCPNLSHMCSCD